MELITFRCSACKQVLKIGADKAGRKAKCKCGAELTIPTSSEPEAPAPAPAAAAPVKAAAVDDDDEGGSYGLSEAFDKPKPQEEKKKRGKEEDDGKGKAGRKKGKKGDDEEEAKPAEKKGEGLKRARGPTARFLLNPEAWRKVQVGLRIIAVGLWIWLGAYLLHKVPVVMGLFSDSDYAKVSMRWRDPKLYTKIAGVRPDEAELNEAGFLVGVVTGDEGVNAGLWMMRISGILAVLGWLVLLAGYGVCLAVPPRFGTRSLVMALLGLGGLNLLLTLVFRLLPLVGAMDYALIPVTVPEVAMSNANLDRTVPLNVLWSSVPMLEFIGALFVLLAYFLEPILLATFLRAVALSMRNEVLEPRARSMMTLGLGVAFSQLAYLMIGVTGTSDVLLWVIRAVYALGMGFFAGMMAWYALVCTQVPKMIEKELGDEDETEPKARAKAKAKTQDEDEDEDEDEEE